MVICLRFQFFKRNNENFEDFLRILKKIAKKVKAIKNIIQGNINPMTFYVLKKRFILIFRSKSVSVK